MEGSIKDLSKYRFHEAKEGIDTAKVLIDSGKYKASVNRSYYAIFHALRAVTAMDGFDSSKHSGIIAYFNKTYVKENIFDKEVSKLIDTAYRLREKADYQDFFIVTKEEAQQQLEKSKRVVTIIEPYLETRWKEETKE